MRLFLPLLLALSVLIPGVAQANPGNFLLSCSTYFGQTDPVGQPGVDPSDHLHDFGGAASINAFSTFASMRAGGSTCDLPDDTAGYWVPAIIASDGTPVHNTGINVYYRGQEGGVIPFPSGQRHVQGDAHTFNPVGYVATFGCGANTTQITIPTSCPAGKGVRESIYFPNCWNGKDIDNSTHKTLVNCDQPGAVRVPQLQMYWDYPPAAVGGHLSSDQPGQAPGRSSHADFWNTWNPFTLAKITDLCLNVDDRMCRVDVPSRSVIDVNGTGRPVIFTF